MQSPQADGSGEEQELRQTYRQGLDRPPLMGYGVPAPSAARVRSRVCEYRLAGSAGPSPLRGTYPSGRGRSVISNPGLAGPSFWISLQKLSWAERSHPQAQRSNRQALEAVAPRASLLLMRSVGASLPVSAACARTGGASRDQSVRERLARRRWLV